jgi:tetratricopeptide (TPR) repeat protein
MKSPVLFVYVILTTMLAVFTVSSAGEADDASVVGLPEAQQLMDDGWLDDAEELLTGLSKKNPKDPEIYYQLARVYLIRDDAQSGNGGAPWDNLNHIEDYAKKAVELDPNDARYYVVLGHGVGLKALRGGTVKKISRARSAKKSYETAVDLDPKSFEAKTSLIEYHMQAPGIAGGDKDEARRLARAAAEIDSVEGFYAWKIVYLHENDLDALEAAIGEVFNDGDKEGYVEKAQLCRRQKDYECSREHTQKLLTVDPENADWYWYLAYAYKKEERLAEAEGTLKAAIGKYPETGYVYRWLGDFYLEQERWDEAIEWFEKTLEVDPTYARALYRIGETYIRSEQDLDRAEECFNLYIEARLKCWWPEKALAHCQIAKIHKMRGNRKAAVKEIKKAKKLNPNNSEIKNVAKELHVR